MTEVTSITAVQLRAAYLAWETAIRADPTAFVSDEECRARPIDEQVDSMLEALLAYVEKTRRPEVAQA